MTSVCTYNVSPVRFRDLTRPPEPCSMMISIWRHGYKRLIFTAWKVLGTVIEYVVQSSLSQGILPRCENPHL